MIDFVEVIGLLAIDGIFFRPVHFEFQGEADRLLRFNYCIEGQVMHRMHDDQYIATLERAKGSMTANVCGSTHRMSLHSHERIRFISIELDRSHYRDKLPCKIDDIPSKLRDVLEDAIGEKLFSYQFTYAHMIHDESLEILDTSYKSLIKTTHQEAKSLEIIAQQYRQYTDDTTLHGVGQVLKEYDRDRLREAKKILKEEMRDPPTIPQLAKRIGINQQKLKGGFKEIYGLTVNQYLQKLRLEHARALLISGKFSVREAAYEVGYSNHGYFSRKFFERFNVLPSELHRGRGQRAGLDQ